MGTAKEFLRQVKPPESEYDFIARSEGSLVLIAPQNDQARDWLTDTAPQDAQFWSGSLVVETRYLRGVIQAMEDDGWRTNVTFAGRQEAEGDRDAYLRGLIPGLPPLQKVMLDLDVAVTGVPVERAVSQYHHYPKTVEKWFEQPGGNPMWYLSDGGYSRVVWNPYDKQLWLTDNSTSKAKSRWEAAAPQREAALAYLTAEYDRLMATIEQPVKEGKAKDFLRQVSGGSGPPTVVVTLGAPAPPSTVRVPVKWVPGMVMVGGGTIPGIELEAGRVPPGLTKSQWDWMLEIIAYALNEGPVYSEEHEADDDEDFAEMANLTPEELEDMWTPPLPAYSWYYEGGEAKFDRDRDRADGIGESDISGVTRFLRKGKGKAKRALRQVREAASDARWAYRGIEWKQFLAIRRTGFMAPSFDFSKFTREREPGLPDYLEDLPDSPVVWFTNNPLTAADYGTVKVRFPWPEDTLETHADDEFVVTHKILAPVIEVLTDDTDQWVPILSARVGANNYIRDPQVEEVEYDG